MRERSFLWDVATLGLLSIIAGLLVFVSIQNERGWHVMQRLGDEQKKVAEVNRETNQKLSESKEINQEILNQLNAGLTVKGGSVMVAPGPNVNPNTQTPVHPGTDIVDTKIYAPGLPPGVRLPVVPKVTRGDENADDGGTLRETLSGEPNSLNPLIDNDATLGHLFGLANDNLIGRSFDDFSVWEPKLARAWTKEMVCLAYVKDKQAEALAAEINQKWDKELKAKLQIRKISADSPDVLRLEISDVNDDYEEVLKKDFGARIEMQYWFNVSFKGEEFLNKGGPVTPEVIAQRCEQAIKGSPDFKGRLMESFLSDEQIVVRMLGDEKSKDAAEKALQALSAAPDNKALESDQKEASGKKEVQCIKFDYAEPYIAQEKPIFTFYLRKDVKWHDGKPFSGKDVVFTFKTTKNPKIECGPQRNYLIDCESCDLVNDDPYTVRYSWRKPYFAAFETSGTLDVLPEHIFNFDNPDTFNKGPQNQQLIGTGAYILKTWDRNQRFEYVRNEDYYGKKPHFDKISIKVVKDPAVELQMLEGGDIDFLGLTPSQMKPREKNKAFLDRFKTNISVANVYRYLGWNARNPLFKDKRVRQALTMLVDRDRICKDIFRGYAIPQHGTVHPESPMYWKGIEKEAWPFDPERAKKLLAEAGWKDTDGDGILDKDGVKFEFTLLIRSNSPEFESLANMVRDSFQGAGIKVNVNNLEWAVMLQKVERLKFDAVLLGWQLSLTEDPYQLWHSSQTHEKESNHCDFENVRADRLIELSRRTLSEKKRQQILEEFQKILLDEQPYTFLCVSKRLVAIRKVVQNVEYKLPGADRDRWWEKKEDQIAQ